MTVDALQKTIVNISSMTSEAELHLSKSGYQGEKNYEIIFQELQDGDTEVV